METHWPRLVRILAAGLAGVAMFAFLSAGKFPDARAQAKEQPITVSLADLLADKQRFKGRLVRIRGYIAIGREMESVFANEEQANSMTSDPKAAIWLNISAAQHKKYRRLSRTYGHVIGRFKVSDCEGHLCAFGGSLDNVRISPH